MNPIDIASHGPVIPVIVIDRVEDALPLAEALLAGGVKVLEVTLRTAAGRTWRRLQVGQDTEHPGPAQQRHPVRFQSDRQIHHRCRHDPGQPRSKELRHR